MQCPVFRACVDHVVAQHVQGHPHDATSTLAWAPWSHFLQGALSTQQILLMLKVNTVVWHVRCLVARGHAFADYDDLLSYARRACTSSLLHKRPSKQRQAVTPAEVPAGVMLYTNDGAARGQSQDAAVQSGAGAVLCDNNGLAT